MSKEKLSIQAKIQIQKPVGEVYEAIIDPEKMSNYFIAASSGKMEAGREIKWKFPEFDDEFPVRVIGTRPPSFISFEWDVEGQVVVATISLDKKGDNDTLVTVIEKEMDNNEKGIHWLKGNTEGWANFLACLKAYLEYGINLRKGAFEFMKK
jgi:uncharacterized protein YndB with AHSA1/START domain